jgi:hypothetical protein
VPTTFGRSPNALHCWAWPDQLRLTSGRVAEICNQFGGSASEISCTSLALAKTSSRMTRIVT